MTIQSKLKFSFGLVAILLTSLTTKNSIASYVMSDPVNLIDPSGLTAADINFINSSFNGYVAGMVASGQRLPGTGVMMGAANNIASTAQMALYGIPKIQGCVGQCQGLFNLLSNAQSRGQISNDFFFFQEQSLTAGYFEHNYMTAVSPADNILMTLDPWRGTVSSQPLHGGQCSK